MDFSSARNIWFDVSLDKSDFSSNIDGQYIARTLHLFFFCGVSDIDVRNCRSFLCLLHVGCANRLQLSTLGRGLLLLFYFFFASMLDNLYQRENQRNKFVV